MNKEFEANLELKLTPALRGDTLEIEENIFGKVTKTVINFREAATREALLTLGWKAPDGEQWSEVQRNLRKKLKQEDWQKPLTKEDIKAITYGIMEKCLDDDKKGDSGHFLLRILYNMDKLLQQNTWQPIETAPKTGEQFLVTDGEYVIIAEWGNYPAAIDLHDCTSCEMSESSKPTRWRPLPHP